MPPDTDTTPEAPSKAGRTKAEAGTAGREELESVVRIVLAVLEAQKSVRGGPSPWYARCGSFCVANWTFVLSILALASLLGASFLYQASPFYYLKQLAAGDRELDAKEKKHDFQQEMAKRSLALGNALLDQGHFEDAAAAFGEALKFDEHSVAASIGKYKAELFRASASGEFDPAVIDARIRFALAADPKSLVVKDEHALAADPKSLVIEDEHALAALGDLAAEIGDLKKAREYYVSALAKRKTAHAYAGLGLVALEEGDFEGAVRELRCAHKRAPHELSYRANLASALLGLAVKDAASSLDQVLKEYKLLVQTDQEKLSPYLEYALALRLKGDFAASRRVIAYVTPMFKDDKVLGLPKNSSPWVFFIGDRRLELAEARAKQMYLRQTAVLTACLAAEACEAEAQRQQLAGSTETEMIRAALEAEIVLLRARHPDLSSRLDAYGALLQTMAAIPD